MSGENECHLYLHQTLDVQRYPVEKLLTIWTFDQGLQHQLATWRLFRFGAQFSREACVASDDEREG